MAIEKIAAEGVKQRLRDLREFMLNESEIVYEFGKPVADYLGESVTPEGFILAAEQALEGLQNSKRSVTGKPIPVILSSQAPEVYHALYLYIPDMAKAACPKDFAQKVKEFYEQRAEA